MMKTFRKLLAKYRANGKRQDGSTHPSAPTSAPAPAVKDASSPPPDNMGSQPQQVLAAATPSTLNIALRNASSSSNVYAYITGRAINNNSAPIFIQSDGRTVYFPTSPSTTQSPLAVDVAIPLGAPGNTVTATIPRIAGGRIWFSIDARLTFLLNPGPAVVEPSVTNPSDPNFNINWTFCEFTFNEAQLFANISYVDFISIPISLTLTNTSGGTQTVPGMGPDGLSRIVDEMRAQRSRDGRPWDQLIYSVNGRALRVLNPNKLLVGNGNAWGDYYDAYVRSVWDKFRSVDMVVNTQAAAGNLTGRVTNNVLSLGEAGTFNAPNAADIFSCDTGPFATGSNPARNAVIPRLAAAFNRSTLLDTNQFPNGSNPAGYYKNAVTNHFARAVHAVQRDGRGYAFPYDDVVPDGGSDVAGTLHDGNPRLFTVAVGGN